MRDLKEILNNIIEDYCTQFDLKPKDLFRDIKSKNGRAKVIKNTNVANLRMTLGYYFTEEFGLPKTFACKFIGYSGHSTMSHNQEKIKWFIETNDLVFSYYYGTLKKVVEKYDEELNALKRVVIKP